MNKYKYQARLVLTFALLISCSNLPSSQETKKVSGSSEINTDPAISPMQTIHFDPTEIPDPTDAALYFSEDQVTDGKIIFSIQEVQPVCHSREDRIQIRFTFKNLTDESINLIAVPVTGRGLMLNSILTRPGKTIHYCLHCRKGDPAPIVTPVSFDALPELGTIEREIQYQIYPFYIEIARGDYKSATPEPGTYLLKFVYMNEEPYSNNVWTGQIASNQIQLCIVE